MKVLRLKQKLGTDFDRITEQCLQEKLPLRKALGRLIPPVCRTIGARDMMIRTMDENLKPLSLRSKGFTEAWKSLLPEQMPSRAFEPVIHPEKDGYIILVFLGVADRVTGTCAFAFDATLENDVLKEKADLVDTAATLLDNYLTGMTSGARKLNIPIFLTEAPGNRSFETGADNAVGQRRFDDNRERQHLSRYFCAKDVQRLLEIPDFYEKYLSPREENIVIYYTEISSFTVVCEKVLTRASAVGELINRWSRMVLDVLYLHDGVFSKMAGDCVIGLFGPPFFESSMEERTENALCAAAAILRKTRELGREMGLEERIREANIADHLTTTNGIHCGPASIGFFGPNEDYTGFSSAMNHTARLQGHASGGEVLITAALLDNLPGGPLGIAPREDLTVDFAGPWEIAVENVTHPLEYYRCYFNKEGYNG